MLLLSIDMVLSHKIKKVLLLKQRKKLILENDIDANTIQGTGKDSRITKGDVLLFLKSNGSLQKTTDNKYQNKLVI